MIFTYASKLDFTISKINIEIQKIIKLFVKSRV